MAYSNMMDGRTNPNYKAPDIKPLTREEFQKLEEQYWRDSEPLPSGPRMGPMGKSEAQVKRDQDRQRRIDMYPMYHPQPNSVSNPNYENDKLIKQEEIDAAIKASEIKTAETQAAERQAAEIKTAERQESERQSSQAQKQATSNQVEINNQLQSKLNTPIAGKGQSTQYQASGAGVATKQNAAKSAGGGIPEQPVGAIISKINEGSGGTSRPQNFKQPDYQNLQFGGA